MKHHYPPPERISLIDIQRMVTGVVSLPAGIVILARLPAIGLSPVAVITGLAFLAFGIYRTSVVARRYSLYRNRSKGRCS